MVVDCFVCCYVDYVCLQVGKMVVEFKLCGVSKGDVVYMLMIELLFMGCIVLFVGDDLIDESVFDVVNVLDGWLIKVGVGLS